jgi:hypothetical protein
MHVWVPPEYSVIWMEFPGALSAVEKGKLSNCIRILDVVNLSNFCVHVVRVVMIGKLKCLTSLWSISPDWRRITYVPTIPDSLLTLKVRKRQ